MSCDTPELRVEKEKRIHAYRTECARFQQLSQNRVERIHNYYQNNIEHALLEHPHNSIPETHIPFLSLDAYESLLASIYEKNKDHINTIVETHYSNSDTEKNDPYGIYKEKIHSLRTRFRIEYANSTIPYPRIILGWDTKNPQTLRIDKNGIVVKNAIYTLSI